MTITLTLHDGRAVTPRLPYVDAAYVVADGLHCECSPDYPLEVAGGRTTTSDDGRIVTAPAGCVRCKGSVGVLSVDLGEGSLFGPEEDQRVLHGRPRVY